MPGSLAEITMHVFWSHLIPLAMCSPPAGKGIVPHHYVVFYWQKIIVC